MSDRNLLRNQLIKAWQSTIDDQYASQLINSERGLQVYFCHALMKEFKEDGLAEARRLFIEPAVVFNDKDRRYPDLVICNTQTIIGVVELKYAPRATPSTDKDMETLAKLAIESNSIELINERFRGPGRLKPYSISSDAVFCWAGVRRNASIQFDSEKQDRIGSRFLKLEAVTQNDSLPTVYVNKRPETAIKK